MLVAMETESGDLENVRSLERQRIAATRQNDVDALAPILDDDLIYINSAGQIYDKRQYLAAIKSHGLTYGLDFDVRETDCRVSADLVILAGIMLGHARLDGEQQVFHFRCISVWRRHQGQWRLIAWQSSSSSGR
jgi:ketosteroid isomerase-like protein